MLEQKWRQETIIDLIKLALGAFLILTPWVFGFTSAAIASGNAWISGGVIGLASIAAIVAPTQWEEWISLAFGLWVAISPWLLGYATNISAMRANAAIGIAVVLLAAAELAMIYRSSPHVTA